MEKISLVVVVWLLLPGGEGRAQEPLFPNAGFESGGLEGWRVEGDAFVHQPTRGDNPALRNRESGFHEGGYWIGGFEKHSGGSGRPGDIYTDDAIGTLTSPPFRIEKKYLSFLIGGGDKPGELGVKLLCEGREIDLASGRNTETMRRCNSDVSPYVGKTARLVVYDNSRGDWGHVNVDDFVASDEPVADKQNQFAILPHISPEDYAEIDYREPLRPQFHFTSGRNWLNDPNGMVHDGTQYHLFFQHNPLSPEWGHMTWAHATSPDMVRWTQRPHALLPYRVDGRTGTIYSGTAVVDHNNSLGLQRGEQKTLCAFYTYASAPRFYQAMAYSTDAGESWTYWNEGRAVVPYQGFDNEERDPKVFWHEASGRWVMALWVQRSPGRIRFFTSENLTDWAFASDLMRDWAFECVDLVFLPTDNGAGQPKAVLYDASFDYEVGSFDGKAFHTESGPHHASGGNFYAAQTFNNSPDGRVVQIGWMRGGPNAAEQYGLPYNQQMSFPCELTLRSVEGGQRLFVWPVEEIGSLVESTSGFSDAVLDERGIDLSGQGGPIGMADVQIEFAPGKAESVEFSLGSARLAYRVGEQELWMRGVDEQGEPEEVLVFAGLAPRAGVVSLRFLIDRLSIESFAFGGERFHAGYLAPVEGGGASYLRARGGEARIRSLKVDRLRSAWRE